MRNTRNICLPEELCRAAEHEFGQRFQSIDEMITELLRELLRDDAARMDKQELEVIEQRLRSMGYV